MSLEIQFLSLFPELIAPFVNGSLLGKAQSKGLVRFGFVNIRDFATDKHRTTDDTPYGGGEGMVLRADVLQAAWQSVLPSADTSTGTSTDIAHEAPVRSKTRTLFLSPQGKCLDQSTAKRLLQYERLILVCGHYEGVDERFIEECVDEEISIGDYVLTGGELAAAVVADAVVRLIPGVVGNEDSIGKETFEDGLLKHPQYTRPRVFAEREVPEVLLGGNHAAIEAWRKQQREARTQARRPDLWVVYRAQMPPSKSR